MCDKPCACRCAIEELFEGSTVILSSGEFSIIPTTFPPSLLPELSSPCKLYLVFWHSSALNVMWARYANWFTKLVIWPCAQAITGPYAFHLWAQYALGSTCTSLLPFEEWGCRMLPMDANYRSGLTIVPWCLWLSVYNRYPALVSSCCEYKAEEVYLMENLCLYI
jgi:hypothetical protein